MRHTISVRRMLGLIFSVFMMVGLLSGCGGTASQNAAKSGIVFNKGQMLHAKQVLEHYDAQGQRVPQYFELWLTADCSLCMELDADGKALLVLLDTKDGSISYDAATHSGSKLTASQVFIPNFTLLKKTYKVSTSNEGSYADRSCNFYLLENGVDDEWMKLYVDKETGYVLLCDTPLFRLRTAMMEEIAYDGNLFTAPSDVKFEEE